LAVAADVGKQFDTAFIPHECLGVTPPPEHVIVPDVGDHELMAHVARAIFEKHALFDLVDLRIEVPVNGKFGDGAAEAGDVGQV
jgi:hypothetical protein